MSVFIIYYHQIVPKWGFDVAYKTFEREVKILKKFFNVITLDDVYEYIQGKRSFDKPSVVITFDDGYLDNFVYAYPILKKHKLKATIFPITSRINQTDTVRPTLEDYWNGKVSFNELHRPKPMGKINYEFLTKGHSDEFLTVAELNKMKDVFSIEGHADIHAKVFYEDKILDFYDGKNGHWSAPYAHGESNDFSKLELNYYGFPIFPDKNNLSVRRGFLKKEVKEFIQSLDKAFFQQKKWKEKLKNELQKNFSSLLEFETEKEREERVKKELKTSKEKLESMINQSVNFLSYPFGHYDEKLSRWTSQFFKAAFTTEKDIVRHGINVYTVPRIAIPKDITSFLIRIIQGAAKK